MLKVMVPIDFSVASVDAAKFLHQMKNDLKVKEVILFHTHLYDVQINTSSPVSLTTKAEAGLDEIIEQLKEEYPSDIVYSRRVTGGDIYKDILSIFNEEQFDLLVIGLTGQGAKSKTVIGTNTMEIASNAPFPVLIVPNEMKYKKVKRLAYAINFTDNTKDDIPFDTINFFTKTLDAELTLVNVDQGNRSLDNIMEQMKYINERFETTSPELVTIEKDTVVDAIDQYVDENNVDLLISVAHKYGFFKSLFKVSVTRRLILQTEVPLLVLSPNQD